MSTAVERVLGEVLDELLRCLCTALEDTPGGAACHCSMVGGREAIADRCTCGKNGCGQAWVRVDRIYAYDTDVVTPARIPACGSPLAAVVEVGVFRCIPTVKGNGEAPSASALTDQVLGQVADAGALAAAINCCTAITSRKHAMGVYTPRDSGNCGGGVWPVTVALSRTVPAEQRPPRRGGAG